MSSYAHASGLSGASSGGALGGGASSSSSAGGFPLRANFFRSLPLSKETVASLYDAAKQNAAACLHQSFNEQWRYVPPEKDGTQLRKDTSNLATSSRFVRAATVLRCQEHEMNMVISNTNTDSWREFMRKCFGKHYIDTMILHSFSGPVAKDAKEDNNRAHRAPSDRLQQTGEARPTLWVTGASQDHSDGDEVSSEELNGGLGKRRNSDTHSVASDDETHATMSTACLAHGEPEEPQELLTVKWGAFDTGGQGKRDLCVLDYLTTTTLPNDASNERVYMWCFSSVEGERVGCMALKDTHNIARATLAKLGVFWRRVSDEETEVIVCGSFASKHAKYVSAIFLQSLNRLQGIVEDLRLSNQIYIHRSTWVKDHERSSCHLCMRNFYALRRKHHCRKCGEVICSDCSVVENVDLPVIGYSKLRLCKVCCLKAKSTPLKRHDKANVFDHLVRARSLSNLHVPEPSPYNARMSFADSGSGSGSSGGDRDRDRDRSNNHSHFHHAHHAHFPPNHTQQSYSQYVATQQQQQAQAVASAVAAARAEQLRADQLFVEATAGSRSSSSFSSSNTNDFELTDSLEDYVTLQQQAQAAAVAQQQQVASAAVHPMMSKELRGLSSTTMASTTTSTSTTPPPPSSSSTASSTPMLATHDDDEYDDFIDVRTLNKQLCAMELQHKATNQNNNQVHNGSATRATANSNMFDLLCELACQTLGCPIASVSIVDATGESIRSASGLDDKPELSDELTLFIDKVMGSTPTIVLDANVDKQVSSLFTRRGAPQIRFFAGCPIHSRTGKKLGYVCVADFTKRDTLGASCAFTMERLATLAVTTMERNIASAKQQPSSAPSPSPAPQQPESYVAGSYGNGYTYPANNQTSHHHPAAIFDRPVPNGSGPPPPPRHRQSNATHPPVSHVHYQPPPQYHSAAQAYQYQDAYPPAHTARVYDMADGDVPVAVGSPVGFAGRNGTAPPPNGAAPSVAPLPRQYNEYSAGYYEAQERMRKLLIKSYHTSQQLATGSSPMGTHHTSAPTTATYHQQY